MTLGQAHVNLYKLLSNARPIYNLRYTPALALNIMSMAMPQVISLYSEIPAVLSPCGTDTFQIWNHFSHHQSRRPISFIPCHKSHIQSHSQPFHKHTYSALHFILQSQFLKNLQKVPFSWVLVCLSADSSACIICSLF